MRTAGRGTRRSRLIDGYKRHVLRDLDRAVVRAVGLTRANAPEADVTGEIAGDLAAQGATLAEVHIDRAYLSSALVRERPPGLTIYCKAWPVRPGPGDRFAKTAFHLDWARGALTCPQGVEMPCAPGGVVHFPAATCAACPLPRGDLRGLPTARPLHREPARARRQHPPRRAPAGGTAGAPAHGGGPRRAARARAGRAQPRPHRGLAG